MTDRAFCYHCRVHHPLEQMVVIETKTGPRWRCLKTLMAAQRSVEERDAFGRAKSEANRAESRRLAEISNRRRLQPDLPGTYPA